ncbi:RING-H2 finger protein ATL50 [Canna indica]|uniref:RING-H2 finger protein ATL50 n=1 Tax=Canna indica TaxID=4628 RepID=A0AAQ3KU59_9LILI|nr:RING-H2 finger protein ATL50 [Canna indica]
MGGLVIRGALFSILSIPLTILLIFLLGILLRLATPIILNATAHFPWPLRLLGDRRLPSDVTLPPYHVGLNTSRYKYSTDKPNSTVECIFCLTSVEEGEEITEIRCKHIFHRHCLDRWLVHRQRATCPLCREVVVPYELMRVKEDDDDEDEDKEFMMMLFCYTQLWMFIFASVIMGSFCFVIFGKEN